MPQRTVRHLTVLLLTLVVTGCAPVTQRLRSLIDEGKPEKAMTLADAWIAEKAERAEAAVHDEVRLLRAEADLALTHREDRVEAYQAYRLAYDGERLFEDLVARARAFEATAWYRDRTLADDTVPAHEAFRARYPTAAEVADSLRREPGVALKAALARGEVSGLEAYLDHYADWAGGGAEAEVATARQALVDLAWEAARTDGSVAALAGYRTRYQEWPEAAAHVQEARRAEVARAVADARAEGRARALEDVLLTYDGWEELAAEAPGLYDEAAQLGLDEARATGTVEALAAFGRAHPEPRWREAALRLEAAAALEALLGGRERATREDEARRFVARYGREPWLPEVGRGWPQRLRAAAETNEEPLWLSLLAALFPSDAGVAEDELKAAEQRRLQASRGDVGSLLDLLRYHPGAPGTAEAEAVWARVQALMQAERDPARASIQMIREGAGGVRSLTLDVRDCSGRRMSGLRAGDFEVLYDGTTIPFTGFRGLEEDRPLDVVFVIDLSGSMETERAAVRAAVTRFSETFRFRNREGRLGLVLFSDDVDEVHPPSGSTPAFLRWMERLPENAGGGSGEDGAAALLRAAALRFAPGAERVVVLMTDEPLQMNREGMAALGIEVDDRCAALRAFGRCVGPCSDGACMARCVGRLEKGEPNAFSECSRQYGQEACLNIVPWEALHQGMAACTAYLLPGSDGFEGLVTRLSERGVRPFLLVADGAEDGTAPFPGVAELADRLGGRRLPVPQDADSSEPYEAALLDIADQLSKQYELTVELPPGPVDPHRLGVLVRVPHLWTAVGALPATDLGALVGLPPRGPCSRLLAFGPEGAWVHDGCAMAWASLPRPEAGPVVEVAAWGDTAVARTDGGRLVVLDAAARRWRTWEGAPADVQALHVGPDDAVAVFSAAGDGPALWRWNPGGEETTGDASPEGPETGGWRRWPVARAGSEPVEAIFTADTPLRSGLCLLQAGRRLCTFDGGRTFQEDPVTGLPGGPVRLVAAPGPRSVLMATNGVWLGRSLDGGRTWSQSWADAPGRISVARLPDRVCAASGGEARCTEDQGVTWRTERDQLEEAGDGLLAASGTEVYQAKAGRLLRLDAVEAREIPSAAVYFDTDVATPSEAMEPFLAELADRLAADPDLLLRVEGHADRRGSDSHNDELAAQRAAATRDLLVAAGVESSRISVLSFGERRPVRKGNSAADLARNRRVELVLLRRTAEREGPCRNAPVEAGASRAPAAGVLATVP